jgi:hypothetical protein
MGGIHTGQPANPEILFVVTLRRDDAGDWSGSFDIPRTGAIHGIIDATLVEVACTESTLAFVTPGPPSENHYTITLDEGGKEGRGELRLGGIEPYRVRVWRISEAEARDAVLSRPQTPRAPLPYTSRELTVTNSDDDTTLAGTLTIPSGASASTRVPAILLLSDAGPDDRDLLRGTHRHFLVLADLLTRRGIAVLRFDDRSTGASTGVFNDTLMDHSVLDGAAAIDALKAQPEVDPARTGVLGLGEGALVASLLAGEPDRVGFAVLLAPAGLAPIELFKARERRQLEALGEDPAYIAARLERLESVYSLIRDGAADASIRDAIRADIRAFNDANRAMSPLPDWQIIELSEQQFGQLNTLRNRCWLSQNPGAALEGVRCDTAVFFGALDMVIPPADNLPPAEAALKKAAAASSIHTSAAVLAGLNHFFQPATTGFEDEYDQIQTTVSPTLIDAIVAAIPALNH